ncbi:hypothetical protein BDN71DRAFT_1248745 [Pleurotus eryngii]|uniref:Uncharacterized protein n=1 Tax=Pleurotus eryngii TaxID=5323 RepID=A0A9P5ZPN3_PLEER|nr:hypothetical protein BDN71DRAFT_1248745 [Pleurotus eryngii]
MVAVRGGPMKCRRHLVIVSSMAAWALCPPPNNVRRGDKITTTIHVKSSACPSGNFASTAPIQTWVLCGGLRHLSEHGTIHLGESTSLLDDTVFIGVTFKLLQPLRVSLEESVSFSGARSEPLFFAARTNSSDTRR